MKIMAFLSCLMALFSSPVQSQQWGGCNVNTTDLSSEEDPACQKLRNDLTVQAAAMLPDQIAKQPERLKAFQDLHARDIAAWSFRAERFGDWLALYVQRGIATERAPLANKLVAAIDLGKSQKISLKPGSAPAADATCGFSTYDWAGDAPKAHADMPYVPKDPPSPLVATLMPGRQASGSMQWSSNGIEINVVIPNCARAAEDDTISFEGSATTLYTPATKGQEAYDAILAAIAKGAPVPQFQQTPIEGVNHG